MSNEIKLTRTNSGLPALWESGGGSTNTGHATIIADPDGEPKTPVYRPAPTSNSTHALIKIELGDLVIHAQHHRKDFTITINRITSIQPDKATLEQLANYSQGEWDETPPQQILKAVHAAKRKATCYHCRHTHYAK